MDKFATYDMRTGPSLTTNENLAYGWKTYEEAASQLPLYEAALGTRLLVDPPGPAVASLIHHNLPGLKQPRPVRYQIIERTLKVIRTGEDSGNCRIFFLNVETEAVYCTVHLEGRDKDPKFHTFYQPPIEDRTGDIHTFRYYGEPDAPFRDDIHVVEVDEAGSPVKVWQ